MDLRKDMGEHGLAGRALADCLCGPRYGRLDERPGGGNSRGGCLTSGGMGIGGIA